MSDATRRRRRPTRLPRRLSRRRCTAARSPTAAARRCCTPTREQYVDVVKALLDDGYEMCVDLTAVDYLDSPGAAAARRRRPPSASRSSSTCSTSSADAAHPPARAGARPTTRRCRSLFDLHPGTEAMEREVFDMFGIALRRPPRPHPHPDAGGLGGPPAAQGLRRRRDPGAVQGAPTRDDAPMTRSSSTDPRRTDEGAPGARRRAAS